MIRCCGWLPGNCCVVAKELCCMVSGGFKVSSGQKNFFSNFFSKTNINIFGWITSCFHLHIFWIPHTRPGPPFQKCRPTPDTSKTLPRPIWETPNAMITGIIPIVSYLHVLWRSGNDSEQRACLYRGVAFSLNGSRCAKICATRKKWFGTSWKPHSNTMDITQNSILSQPFRCNKSHDASLYLPHTVYTTGQKV